MHKAELEKILGLVRTAQLGSDWHGEFTTEIRRATSHHRFTNIFEPLDKAVKLLVAEIASCNKRIEKRRRKEAQRKQRLQNRNNHLPYSDN